MSRRLVAPPALALAALLSSGCNDPYSDPEPMGAAKCIEDNRRGTFDSESVGGCSGDRERCSFNELEELEDACAASDCGDLSGTIATRQAAICVAEGDDSFPIDRDFARTVRRAGLDLDPGSNRPVWRLQYRVSSEEVPAPSETDTGTTGGTDTGGDTGDTGTGGTDTGGDTGDTGGDTGTGGDEMVLLECYVHVKVDVLDGTLSSFWVQDDGGECPVGLAGSEPS